MKREQWSSNIGFLLAATGSAVGLGNIWKFPYVVGNNGGGIFILVYLLLLILLGAPLLLTELAIGRSSHKNAIDACSAIRPGWGFVGLAGVVGAFVILSYYSVIGGWVIKYLIDALLGAKTGDAAAKFEHFSAATWEPVAYHLLFTLLGLLTVAFGITKGIERVSKFSLPFLVIALILIAFYAVTLPDAWKGVRFLLVPDTSHLHSLGDVGRLIVSAMGQVFFSMSIGMGTMITYGSYLDKSANLQKNAVMIPLFDFIIALLAGLATMPCVFSFGLTPSAGTGLLFQALPSVFAKMQLGRGISILFFALVLLAALTSAISLLESIVAFLTDRLPMKRATAVILTSIPIFLLGIGNSLSFGVWSDKTLFGMTLFDWMVFLSDNVLMPIGGFFLCILAGYVWGVPNLLREVSSGGRFRTHGARTFRLILRVVAPVMIAVLFAVSLFTYF